MSINAYLSIIILNANEMVLSKDIGGINGVPFTYPDISLHMLSIRDSFQIEGHTQTESEEMGKDIL